MSFYSPQTSGFQSVQRSLKVYDAVNVQVKYRDTSGTNAGTITATADQLWLDLSSGYDEQILTGSARFKLGSDTFLDRDGTLFRNVDPSNNSGISSGLIQYGTGNVEINSWTPGADNLVSLESLTTTTDLPPLNQINFRTPVIPIRPQSLTVVVASLDFGQLTLTADENGVIETSQAHGTINYDTGFVSIFFYTKTEITAENQAEIEAQAWYDPLLKYEELGKQYVNVPVWVDASSVRYNAVAYTYIPLDADILGLSATRLPIDGRVPIFRIGDIGIVSSSKSLELPDHIAGKTYDLAHQRISWAEIEDANGTKLPFSMYVVDYDYGKVTLSGDFALNTLVAPLTVKYRYQDMGLIRDVQINGQITFTKPLTHNYDAIDTIVGSALVIGDMQSRYTRKFVQQTWNNAWADEANGGGISANYNDALYPIVVTNKGAIQERWALIFTDATNFRCVGEYSGQIGTGSVNIDFAPINPVTGLPYFTVKKEGWGAGWANGNVLRFNTVAANFPVWVIRTVKQSEPTVMSDQFQIMLRGDIDRIV
ncbi:hypothetical protein [Acinetobacter indicus]|uniref:hypothetical protein n=1 Tax=Acinetobacter indicus TaxID=756892 RepID=UPI0025764459|nr:hypothetical protein [Acinetobacter indicus]MDM1771026.1 hypothetical protein [Acinetobacter indicus]MDM1773782.1 hypothetical protein [Acinetobacter indicus]